MLGLELGSGQIVQMSSVVCLDYAEGVNLGGALATVACHRFVHDAECAKKKQSKNDEDKMLIRLSQKRPNASTDEGFNDSRISL